MYQEESRMAKKSITHDLSSHLVSASIEVKILSTTACIRHGKTKLL